MVQSWCCGKWESANSQLNSDKLPQTATDTLAALAYLPMFGLLNHYLLRKLFEKQAIIKKNESIKPHKNSVCSSAATDFIAFVTECTQ